MHALQPLRPLNTVPLFATLGDELVGLLRSFEAADWERPTVCSGWAVRDVAAHLLDTALRRISADRDDFVAPPEPGEVTDYASLVGFLDRLNAEWVKAARRLSPALLTDLIEVAEGRLTASLEGLDLDGEARFAVSWAGEEESKLWFDVARELADLEARGDRLCLQRELPRPRVVLRYDQPLAEVAEREGEEVRVAAPPRGFDSAA